MKKLVFGILLLSVVAFVAPAQDSIKSKKIDYSLAHVKKLQGKYVFVKCEPVAAYDVAFEISFGMPLTNEQINTTDKIVIWVFNRAKKLSKKKGIDFDAIIIMPSGMRDIAITWKE